MLLTAALVRLGYLLSYDAAGVEHDGGRVKLHGLRDLLPRDTDLQRQRGHLDLFLLPLRV